MIRMTVGTVLACLAAMAQGADPAAPSLPTFRAEARLVQAYVSIFDKHGNPLPNLTRDRFQVLDAGHAQALAVFEGAEDAVSCALLLDTTGSMVSTLPALRSSALRLIEDMRPVDWVAVYGFNTQVSELQPFTRNRDLAKRAILRTHAASSTGLYDALLRVSHDLAGRAGKKAIVVFTDGEDNASALTAEIAINRAKRDGVPIYTIAQGGSIADARTGRAPAQ